MVEKAYVDVVKAVLIRTLSTTVDGLLAFLPRLEHESLKYYQLSFAKANKEVTAWRGFAGLELQFFLARFGLFLETSEGG